MTEEFKNEALPHMSMLYNYAYKNTRNKLDAEDLLQETYLRAFRYFHKYKKGTNCRAWLFRLMRNQFLNDCKKNQRDMETISINEVENYLEYVKSDRIENTDFQEKVFSNLLDDDVTIALNSLQNDFKTLIILCDLEGLSYEEIAEFMQYPVDTVRNRLHRARNILGRKLSKYAKYKGFNVKKEYLNTA